MSEAMDQVRMALKSFCPTGTENVSVPQLAEALGLETGSQKQVLRDRLRQLCKQGELEKDKRGLWRRVLDAKPRSGQGYVRMWRVMRAQGGVFCVADIWLIASTDRSFVNKYMVFLVNEGLVNKAGMTGQTTQWRLTAAGREQRETPWPPRVEEADPFAKERAAVATLCRMMLTQNPHLASVQNTIVTQLNILTMRFNHDNSSTENSGHEGSQGDEHY